ncbi:hypothetical protein ASPBRDRAFT_40504 [Aspergillus brasiliensis CBS 101740]|uniref:Uncharacterized protein n=1 Tax=Aspergillus brasiliensis (strain CBS 101740 / IMI 381727 / IBT 21946) TaxID=767769 RepID=A0A1L9UUD5_ASPBC|nr:hypothetical protein ASPBRDRAFT_40504 [Aspergillus brasiliensis CBS 101740]
MAKPTDDVELSPTDLGLARFVEAHLAIVLRTKPNPQDCERAVQILLAAYPMLAMRMDFWRTKFCSCDYPQKIYHSRTVKKDLNQVLPCRTAEVGSPPVQLIDTQLLADCLNFNRDTWGEICGEPVLRITAVTFNDAWAVRFIISHTLGDIRALHWIVESFFVLLSGREVPAVSPIRSNLAFNPEYIDGWKALSTSGTTHPVAKDHQHDMVAGWFRTISSGVQQRLWSAYDAYSPRRQVHRSLFIPQCIVDHWVQKAQEAGVRVTEHDLLMGFIYEATYQALSTTPHFSFFIGFQQHLQSPSPLGNTWFLIPIPDLYKSKSKASPSTPSTSKNHSSSTLLPALFLHAQLIRHTITQCRHPACFPEIHEQHRQLGTTPWRPGHFGTRTPHLKISCWTKQPWYDLDCAGENPVFTDMELRFYRLFDLLGVHGANDFVGTIKCTGSGNETLAGGQEGYWVAGQLAEITWTTMFNMLTTFSTTTATEPSARA